MGNATLYTPDGGKVTESRIFADYSFLPKLQRTISPMARKKALVTGVAGFIGHHLAQELLKEGYIVYGIDNLSTGKIENVPPDVEFRVLDVANIAPEDVRGLDVVFHQAALPRVPISIEDPVGTNRANIDATVALYKACVDGGVPRVVYASSSSVYGDADVFPQEETQRTDPLSPYAVQKLVGEIYGKVFHQLFSTLY